MPTREYIHANTPKFDVKQKPKPSRELIKRKIREARKNLEKDKNITFRYKPDEIETYSKFTNKMLSEILKSIAGGKRPVILLPDTSMRHYGILFHAALKIAFPELFLNDKIPFVMFVVPFRSQDVKTLIPPELIKLLKTRSNLDVLVFDDAVEDGYTMTKLRQDLKEYNPKIEPRLNLQIPLHQTTTRLERTIKDYPVYIGGNRVIKGPIQYYSKGKPKIIIAKRSEYIKNNIEEKYRLEFLMRKELYKLGIQLGQQFREQLQAQQKR